MYFLCAATAPRSSSVPPPPHTPRSCSGGTCTPARGAPPHEASFCEEVESASEARDTPLMLKWQGGRAKYTRRGSSRAKSGRVSSMETRLRLAACVAASREVSLAQAVRACHTPLCRRWLLASVVRRSWLLTLLRSVELVLRSMPNN